LAGASVIITARDLDKAVERAAEMSRR